MKQREVSGGADGAAEHLVSISVVSFCLWGSVQGRTMLLCRGGNRDTARKPDILQCQTNPKMGPTLLFHPQASVFHVPTTRLFLRDVHGDVPASLLPRLCTPCGKKLMGTGGGVSLTLFLPVSSHPWDIDLKRTYLSQLCSQTMFVWAIWSTGL